jgi:hypothetical protein
MFSKSSASTQQTKSELDSLVDQLYNSGSTSLNTYLSSLEANYTLTLKDTHNPLIIKCQAVKDALEALKADRNIYTPEFRQKIETAISDIETDIDMIPIKIRENGSFEHITFANINVYPASYMEMVKDIDGSIHQVLKVFEDYKSARSLVLHPKRHHMAEAKKITDKLELILKNQGLTLDQKVVEAKNFINKVKNGMIGTMEIKIESPNPKQLSSFLKRLHYSLDKLLVTLPVELSAGKISPRLH